MFAAYRRQSSSSNDGHAVEGAVMLTLGGAYMFFCTGHFCEFAGLQYTAGQRCSLEKRMVSLEAQLWHCSRSGTNRFHSTRQMKWLDRCTLWSRCTPRNPVRAFAALPCDLRIGACAGFAGIEDFDFRQSGALLALNTFGPHVLACLALPLVCLPQDDAANHGGGHAARRQAVGTAVLKGRPYQAKRLAGSDSCQLCTGSSAARHSPGQTCARTAFHRHLLIATLTSMLCRSLTALAATASAAIQRRHLMVWALFAPKFVFEAVTLIVCDAVLVTSVAMM